MSGLKPGDKVYVEAVVNDVYGDDVELAIEQNGGRVMYPLVAAEHVHPAPQPGEATT
jgi:hypothetical protein